MVIEKINTFLKELDGFGESYSLTYRGNSSHGTRLGGCCTLLLRIFFWFYLGIQVYGLIAKPGYSV